MAWPKPPDKDLCFQLIGPVTAWSDGTELPLGPPKQRAVLALLLLGVGNLMPMRTIINTIWGDDPPRRAGSTVHVYVSRIRALLRRSRPLLPVPLLTVPGGYRLDMPPHKVDFYCFTAQLDRYRAYREAGRLADAFDCCRQALEMWHEDPLSDLDDLLRERLKVHVMQRRQRAAVIEYAELSDRLGQPAAALPRLEALAEIDPTDEPVHARLVAAYAATGRRAAALDAYERVRLALAGSLGVDPSDQLREVHLRVLRS